MYLVYRGARRACLIDDLPEGKDVQPILDIAANLGLDWCKEYHNRWLVARLPEINRFIPVCNKHEHHLVLGQLLGFLGYDHDWSNYYRDRMIARIAVKVKEHKLDIAFVLEKSKTNESVLYQHLSDTVAAFSTAIPESVVSFKIVNCPSILRRIKALLNGDRTYIIKHIKEFHDDVYNYSDTDNIIDVLEEMLSRPESDLSELGKLWQTFK